MSPRRFSLIVLAGFAAAALAIVVFVGAVDPYWLWRERVGWQFNAAFENRMRFVKSLHVLSRRPSTVLLGSSVVYRGLDPDDVARDDVYNLGISSLRIREAEAYVRLLVRWTRPRAIVLGVDYFAFDANRTVEPGFDPTLPSAEYALKAGFTAFLSASALRDAWRLARRPVEDTDGTWHRNGFKLTRARTSEEVAEQLRMTAVFFSDTRLERAELAALERIIEITRAAGVRLVLFIPPYHGSWLRAAASAQPALDFATWADAVGELARRQGAELWDFARANPFADAAMGMGPESRWYLDPSHFSPALGRWILERIGLPMRNPGAPVPESFGVRVQ